MLIKLILKNKN